MISMVCDKTIIIKRKTIMSDIEKSIDINQHLHDCIY